MGLPPIIVITGIDGSGKTTQSEMLSHYIDKKGIKCSRVQQFACEFSLAKIFIGKFAKKLIALERKYSDNPHFIQSEMSEPSLLKFLIKKIAEFRILSMSLFRTWNKILKNRNSTIIIFDRYIYDDVNKSIWLYNTSPQKTSVLYALVPKPIAIFYLDLPAEIGWKREIDGDTTLIQHISKKEIYDSWFNMYKKTLPIYKISTHDNDPSQVHSEIIKILEKTNNNLLIQNS